jgi:hypothetical protein
MKKILLVMLFFSSQIVHGQEIISGSFDDIVDARKTNLVIDWSKMKIAGMDPEDWIRYRQETKPEIDARIELEDQLKPLLHQMFLPNCNKKTYKRNFILVRNKVTPYTLIISPLEIDAKGNNICDYDFTETESGKSLLKIEMKTKGGLIGSISNLWRDAFELAGDEFGDYLDSKLKKARKKKN